MENKNLFRKLVGPKFKDSTIEQLKQREKTFNRFSWWFLILSVVFTFLGGLSLIGTTEPVGINVTPTATDIITVATLLLGFIGALGCGVVGVGFLATASFLEVARRHVMMELRLREVTAPLLQRIEQLEHKEKN